jgi:group I intron endonuclease
MEIKIGIYKILNLTTKKVYIGSSTNIEKRIKRHLMELKNNNHYNIHLQRAYNCDGKDAFCFDVLEECGEEILTEREEYYINVLNAIECGYNMNPKGNRPPSWLGKKHKESTLLKMSKAQKGKKISQYVKDVASSTHKNKTISKEHIEMLKRINSGSGNAMYGKSFMDIWVQKYGKEEADIRLKRKNEKARSIMLGRTVSAKTKAKLSGKNSHMFGKKLRDVWVQKYGKEEAEVRYEKWKKSNLGRKASDETKKLFSQQRMGNTNPACKIKDEEIPKILEMIRKKVGITNIAKIYGVSRQTIYSIKSGKRAVLLD